jgi:chromosomal replication initiation ATPase DnaA
MDQFPLPFDWPAPETAESFIVTAANSEAVKWLEHPGAWPVRAALLTGPRKSGRSLLARIVAAKIGGTMIDDAEACKEADIFHRWNLAQEERKPLIIVALYPPPQWRVGLPDLSSRLKATPHVRIDEPDDQLIALLLERLLAQRGLGLKPEVAAYVLARIERSYVAILRFVDALDNAALSQKRGLSISLSRAVLEAMGMEESQLPLPGTSQEV